MFYTIMMAVRRSNTLTVGFSPDQTLKQFAGQCIWVITINLLIVTIGLLLYWLWLLDYYSMFIPISFLSESLFCPDSGDLYSVSAHRREISLWRFFYFTFKKCFFVLFLFKIIKSEWSTRHCSQPHFFYDPLKSSCIYYYTKQKSAAL